MAKKSLWLGFVSYILLFSFIACVLYISLKWKNLESPRNLLGWKLFLKKLRIIRKPETVFA